MKEMWHHGTETKSPPQNTVAGQCQDLGAWTSFLSCPGTRTLSPLLLLSGSLILRTRSEELQLLLLLRGSLWPEMFTHVAPLPTTQWDMMSLQVFSICRQRQITCCYITDWTAACLKVETLRPHQSSYLLSTNTTFLRGWWFLFQPEHKMMKHRNCFILNVSSGFWWLVCTLLEWKYWSSNLCFLISFACLYICYVWILFTCHSMRYVPCFCVTQKPIVSEEKQ